MDVFDWTRKSKEARMLGNHVRVAATAAALLLYAGSTPATLEQVEDEDVVTVLAAFVKAYAAGNSNQIGRLATRDIEAYKTTGRDAFVKEYRALFERTESRRLVFRQIRIRDSRAVGWLDVHVQGPGLDTWYSGTFDMSLARTESGLRISRLMHTAHEGEAVDYRVTDAGQMADVATTAVGVYGFGATEANPALAPMVDSGAAGFVPLVIIKLGAARYAETLENQSCRELLTALGGTGWMAAAANVGMLTIGPAGAVAGALIGWAEGSAAAQRDSERRCQGEFGEVDVAVVDSALSEELGQISVAGLAAAGGGY